MNRFVCPMNQNLACGDKQSTTAASGGGRLEALDVRLKAMADAVPRMALVLCETSDAENWVCGRTSSAR